MKINVLRLLLLLLVLPLTTSARTSYVIADISTHEVALDYRFKGQYVTISLIYDGESDIILAITGPDLGYKIWKKEKRYGIWLNGQSYSVPKAKSYFSIAATKNIYEITDIKTLRKYNLDFNYDDYKATEEYPSLTSEAFKQEFIKYRQKLKLYPLKPELIEKASGNNLLRTKLFLPEHAVSGIYKLEVYAFRNGKMVSQTSSSFTAKKYGLYARVEFLSMHKTLQYSLISIIIALAAGAAAGFVFRKDKS
jgi:uncharacterized protein (TIGR02186 family)